MSGTFRSSPPIQPAFTDPAFHRAHDAMLCIAQSSQIDRDDRTKSSPEAWIKPAADMRKLFEDLPEAIENTSAVRSPLRLWRSQAQANPAQHRGRPGGRGRPAAA
jgi:DNA polymerase III alpha subunit